jgi:hypothetical protein
MPKKRWVTLFFLFVLECKNLKIRAKPNILLTSGKPRKSPLHIIFRRLVHVKGLRAIAPEGVVQSVWDVPFHPLHLGDCGLRAIMNVWPIL